MKIFKASLLALTLTLLAAAPALAAALIVTNAADSGPGTLRNLVASASSGDTITFANTLSGQTILLTNGSLLLNESFDIDASALTNGIIINGNHTGTYGVFDSIAGITNVLTALTIANGFANPLAGGGGIVSRGNLTMNRCTLTGNSAGYGGGIYNEGVLTLNNSTLAGNAAGFNGGAIYNDSGSVAVTHCTISGNSAPAAGNGEGGGIYNYNGQLAVTNSIVAGNTSTTGGADIDNSNMLAFGGSNLVQSINGAFTGPVPIAAPPLLAPPGNYGGPTQTRPPLLGSRAINAGSDTSTDTLTTDQRGAGFPRKSGVHVDIGAVEVQLPPFTLALNGAAVVTNECHAAYTDAGATATGAALLIAGGHLFSLALKSDGTVAAWGRNNGGQTSIPVGLSNVVAIAGGGLHSLALKSDGTVAAWGDNLFGATSIPVGLSNVVAIAAGFDHNLVLKSNGTVAGWGYNAYGQTTIPVGLSNVVAIAGGFDHSLALKSDATVAAWGYSYDGETTIPVGLSNVVAIAGGGYHSLALKSDGTVVGWGYNGAGETNIPVGLSNVVAIAGGGHHSLALKNDGTVVGWGASANGQTTIPVGLSNVVAIAGGSYHSLALKSDGTVVGWGYNEYGQTNIPAGLGNLSVTVSGSVDTNTPGSYLLTYSVANSFGSVATATRSVVVQDTTPPVITILGGNPLTLALNSTFIDPGAAALDTCGGSFAASTNSTVNTAVAGTYFVTYSSIDNYGNSATNTRTVFVPAVTRLIAPTRLANGSFQFSFTNVTGPGFTVFASTNVAWPFNAWSNLGPTVETPASSGQYQFTDPQATTNALRFYRVRSP